jgi:deoxyribodipyrimidine photo-lyase
MMMQPVPKSRIHACNGRGVNGSGAYVLYWMISARRRHWNFALQRAVHWAVELRKPLVILEPLNCSYSWASARFHTALMQGMRDNRKHFEGSAASYYPYLERFSGAGRGLIQSLSDSACVVVTDDF